MPVKKKTIVSHARTSALNLLPAIDIPAKGRIAHHIRTGRFQQALALLNAGQFTLWKSVWGGAKPFLQEQLSLLKQLETLLLAETRGQYAG